VSVDAANVQGCSQADTGDEWWRSHLPPSPRKVTAEQPLQVIIAGGGGGIGGGRIVSRQGHEGANVQTGLAVRAVRRAHSNPVQCISL
jgi:hypothetical protein